jgi:hypothetical protein
LLACLLMAGALPSESSAALSCGMLPDTGYPVAIEGAAVTGIGENL